MTPVRDLDAAHSKVKEFAWEPDYFARKPMRETKYKIPRRSKDPFRTLLRDYVAMEEEKDNRQYGALEDVVARTRSPERAQHRWMEVLKPLLSMTTCAEYAAVKCMASLVDTVDNPELRQGYVAQMLDEMRHTNQETYLIRYLARHAPDPAGFNSALSARSVNPLIRAARGAVFDVFLNEDPLTCSIQVQVVGEAGYTNAVFVAATEIAAANDDPATPSVFLNIQSDEVRHMANGYATLAALLAEPDNLPTIQRDLDVAFWRLHVFMDNFLGVVYDYFPKVRLRSYREYWEQWIWEDWIGGYVERLAPFGLEVPRWTERIRTDIAWGGHTCAMVAAALWPVHYWRHDVMGPDDFEYLEEKYPGWDRYYGKFWEQYEEMADPANGALALSLIESIPALCRVCHMPVILPRPDLSDSRLVRDAAGRKHALCSEPCEWLFREAPWRYQCATWLELYDGMDLAEYIERVGLLRSDGRTLVGQPHLRTDEKHLWTIDDIKRMSIEIRDPLRDVDASTLPVIA